MNVKIFALRRSGHHAIINWIRWSLKGPVLFLNDSNAGETGNVRPDQVHVSFGKLDYRIPSILGRRIYDTAVFFNRIENYEDATEISSGNADKTIIIIRDFYNNMASRLKWERDFRSKFRKDDMAESETQRQMENAINLWKQYAYNSIHTSRDNIYQILYDKWLVDADYRKEKATELGVAGDDVALKKIAVWGPGSSFQGRKGTPSKEQLQRRFEYYIDDDYFCNIIRDKECLDLNRQLFGDCPSVQWAEAQ